MPEPVRVEVGGCRCPGTPHPVDYVLLKPKVDVPLGIAAWYEINTHAEGQEADLRGALAGVLIRNGIVGWSFVDAKGAAELVTPANIDRLLPFWDGGMELSRVVFDLYIEGIYGPLVSTIRQTQEPSDAGPTETSTAPIPISGRKRPARSRRSSPSGSAGKPSEVRAR